MTSQSLAPQCWIGGSHGGQGCAGRRGLPPARPHWLAHLCLHLCTEFKAGRQRGRLHRRQQTKIGTHYAPAGGQGPTPGCRIVSDVPVARQVCRQRGLGCASSLAGRGESPRPWAPGSHPITCHGALVQM